MEPVFEGISVQLPNNHVKIVDMDSLYNLFDELNIDQLNNLIALISDEIELRDFKEVRVKKMKAELANYRKQIDEKKKVLESYESDSETEEEVQPKPKKAPVKKGRK